MSLRRCVRMTDARWQISIVMFAQSDEVAAIFVL